MVSYCSCFDECISEFFSKYHRRINKWITPALLKDVRQGQIRDASVDRNGVITGEKRSGEAYTTVIPGGYDRDLINDLS